MNAALKEQLSQFLIASLAAVDGVGMRKDALLRSARTNVVATTTEPDVDAALRELADKRIAREYQPDVGPARWRITPYGLDVAREAGLA